MKNKINIGWFILAVFVFSSCSYNPNYKAQIKKITQEWKDALKVVGSVKHSALGQPVFRLQEIKREAAEVRVPADIKTCYDHYLKYMDLTINGYLMLMRDQASESRPIFKASDEEAIHWQMCIVPKDQAARLKQEIISGRGSLAQATLRTLSASLENYAAANSGFYPAEMTLLTNARPPFVKTDPCAKSALGYSFTCAMSEAGYRFVASPFGIIEQLGGEIYIMRTGGVLMSTQNKNDPRIGQSIQSYETSTAKNKKDPFAVSGFVSGEEPLIIIGDKTLKKGDTTGNYTISEITSDHVEFVDKNGKVMRKGIGK